MIKSNFEASAAINFGPNFFSSEFLEVINKKLRKDFIGKTKINDSKGLIQLNISTTDSFYIRKHPFQMIKVCILIINFGCYANIVWRMKSDFGLPVRPYSTDIDEDSFDIWFEDLPVEVIVNRFHKKAPDLSIDKSLLDYKLEVNHFFNDSTYLIIKCSENKKNEIEDFISDEINSWNRKSEMKSREAGVFHNGRAYQSESEGELIYYIDLGSASEIGLIHLLNKLNNFRAIKNIEVTSFVD